ncbi:AraC family transcriptional regulator, transcriptional activator FtrA [Saccharopolyspora antimicrobica]|uniref:AraC family transcriptional regulator with amidase-like domain n=1 Tax=Saccharopolyspora antimicrobica TaxID=455193 RepID=A0A1I5CRW6_9PSEU|nr:helix-turn-helix domain-containing protein [Saccharopolyspora antimicrobica]RKT88766.1 AraC family transcriptional regulator with amidase-like domain [Saccharopolyspora antimicrobica]SFN89730.1 AraC family transcriptional regulator, transcriptional activator FtrA [Saccharopolyspora antimicrobica]
MHRVVALVRAPQSTFELGCAAEVFGLEARGVPKRYTFGVCAEQPGPVATRAGYAMLVTDGLEALDRADTVIIPGWPPAEKAPVPEVVRALRRAHERGARLVSICSGAFALAHTGLLDGRRATTHWARTAELAESFPAVQVDHDVLYVDHGDVATSAGAGAGIDLCLHLVRADQGAAYAAHVARSMVMPPHREGGQLQYSAPAHPVQMDGSLAPLLEWAMERLGEPLGVEDLAARAGVSSRTLNRRFTDQLGTGPGQWLLTQRLAAARELLENSDLTLEAIAHRVGLSSATNLRRRFLDALGTTPGAYRRAFRTA